MKYPRILAMLLIVMSFAAIVHAEESISLIDGVKISVTVKSVSSKGALVNYEGVQLLFSWDTMPANEALRVWESYLDKKNPEHWFDLGMYAKSVGMKDKAGYFFANAVKLDPAIQARVPSLTDPAVEISEIKKLLDDAQKAVIAKNYDLALQLYTRVYDWPNRESRDEALRDTDLIDHVLLNNQIKLLEKAMFEKKGFSRMGRRWVTVDERKRREKDINGRDESRRLDGKEDERHVDWDNAWERSGEMYRIRTNVPKWYLLRYKDRLDVLLNTLKDTFSMQALPDARMQVNVYGSRSLYVEKASSIKPGTSNLGGFYAENSIHLFLEVEQDDLSYEDISILSLEYLSASAFLHAYSKSVPFWLESGLSLYVQDSVWTSPLSVALGTAPNRYAISQFLNAIDTGALFEPARIAAISGGGSSFERYASWAMVYYLLQGAPTGTRTSFIKAVKSLDTDSAAITSIAKDDKLAEEVIKFARKAAKPLNVLQVEPYPMF